MHARQTRRLLGTTLLLACCGLPSFAGEYEYEHSILRLTLDGTLIDTVLEPSGYCAGIGLDLDAGKIYFSDEGASPADPDGRIRRANLDGSNVEDLVAGPDHFSPTALALDLAGGKIYWLDPRADKVRRAGLDGSDIEILIDSTTFFAAIALDLLNGKMYLGSGHRMWRANLDGSNLEELFYNSNSLYLGIALDVANGKMYFTDPVHETIHRADLDGSNIELLLNHGESPWALALDLPEGKMYWTDSDTKEILRASLDGSDVEFLFGGLTMYAIALDLDRSEMYVYGWTRTSLVPAVSTTGAVALATLMLFGATVLLARRLARRS